MNDEHLILSSGELFELTGYVQHCAQARWLTRNGWKHVLDHKGRPKVDRRYYESRMGHNQDTLSAPEPDFAALYGQVH